ncbi:hypothetical protein ACIBI3_44750 [Actinomadura luteofluorescens]|uniref:hypothetical protein n=1 Tax=Actinomadura luteofluorescens TaxID=46163 RepID=UPI0037A1FF33
MALARSSGRPIAQVAKELGVNHETLRTCREHYGVCAEVGEDPLYTRICKHAWLMDNVAPGLPQRLRRDHLPRIDKPTGGQPGRFSLDRNDPSVLPRWVIAKQVAAFLQATPDLQLWASYGAYDHVVLCQLWGAMVDLPDGIPMHTHDIQQEADRLGNPTLPEQAHGHHTALADARHVQTAAESLAARKE